MVSLETVKEVLSLESEGTRKTYLIAWRQWEEFSKGKPTRLKAFAFLGEMKRRGASALTLRLKYHSLASVYNKLVALEIEEKNPFHKLAAAFTLRDRSQVRPTAYVSAKQINQAFELPDLRTRAGVRDAAILACFFGGGLRISEVHGLNVGDVRIGGNGADYRLVLRKTKAGKMQTQPLASHFAEKIVRIVAQRKEDGANENSPLFVLYYKDGSTREERFCIRTLRRFYRYTLSAVGAEAAPHSARASYATHLLTKGATYEQVAFALRHNDTQQVSTYDKRRKEEMDNVGGKICY